MSNDEIAAVLLVLRFPEHHREEAAMRLVGKHWQPMTEVLDDEDGTA